MNVLFFAAGFAAGIAFAAAWRTRSSEPTPKLKETILIETVAAEIARAGLTGDARDRVADAFRNRRDEIDRQRNESVVSGYLERIKQAKTKEELGEIYQNFEGERMVLEFRQTVYSAIDARSEEIEQQQGGKK